MMLSTLKLEEKITEALPGALVKVENPNDDGMHFSATVVAPQFEGVSMLEQHKLVKQALKAEFDSFVLHAMSLKTFTPKQWAQKG